jgi:serine protease Do
MEERLEGSAMFSKKRIRHEWLFTSIGVAFFLTISLTIVATAVGQSRKSPGGRMADFVQLAEKLAPVVVNVSATQAANRSPSFSQPRPGPGPFEGRNPHREESDPFGEFWRRFFGDQSGSPEGARDTLRTALGSGFIIDQKGLVLTNNHVVENADKIIVKFTDEREFSAKVVGRDARTDLAVLQISNGGESFAVAPLGDSGDLEVGEWVVAMGSPFGLDNSLTAGVVSAKGRHIGIGPYDNFIQTDASINPGNSGGPLVNLRGEVVGINTAIFSRTGGNLGIGFATPINLAKEIVPELINHGKVTRGWLGVSIQRVTPEVGELLGVEKSRGALITSVVEGSPAADAGIKPGDVIVEFDGDNIEQANELPALVARADVGDTAELTLLRAGRQISATVKIGELKDQEIIAAAPKSGALGLTVQNLTPQIAEGLGVKHMDGVVVTAVRQRSAAAEAGLRRGDIIIELNRNSISNTDDFQRLVKAAESESNLLFLIRRGERNFFLALRSPGAEG